MPRGHPKKSYGYGFARGLALVLRPPAKKPARPPAKGEALAAPPAVAEVALPAGFAGLAAGGPAEPEDQQLTAYRDDACVGPQIRDDSVAMALSQ